MVKKDLIPIKGVLILVEKGSFLVGLVLIAIDQIYSPLPLNPKIKKRSKCAFSALHHDSAIYMEGGAIHIF